MTSLIRLSALYRIIRGMEKDLYLDQLSHSERVVLMSVVHLADASGQAKTDAIIDDCKEDGLSRPTVFRCLKMLTKTGKLHNDQFGYYKPAL